MKALIIAAGRGSRLGHYTDSMPKPLVAINNLSFFENTIKHLRDIGIQDIGAVIGYKKENFKNFKDITFFINNNWQNNNILHSLFYAKDFLDDDTIILYGDIWFERSAIDTIFYDNSSDFTIAVDDQWDEYYKNRTDHPISEAENVHYDSNLNIKSIGKHIYLSTNPTYNIGEFMGLLKISKKIIHNIKKEFEILERQYLPNDNFQQALHFEKAYLTDFIQYLISKSYDIKCVINHKGWFEIDTIQDLNNLKERFKNVK
jgi:choline kinase